ncbi:MAG: hypothetical protein ACI90V_012328, partial [Bacillariaceae sp.]
HFIFLFVAEKVQLKHVRVKRRTAIEWNSVTKQKLHMKREKKRKGIKKKDTIKHLMSIKTIIEIL